MSGRFRGPPLPLKGGPHAVVAQDLSLGRNLGPVPHPALIEEMREPQFGMGPRSLPPSHLAIIEERLAGQHQEIQGLLIDNQRLAATHVALKQEVEAAQYELQQADRSARSFLMEKDIQMREFYEKSAGMEADLRGMDAMKSELRQLHADITDLNAIRQKLSAQVQAMTHDLARASADLQQVPAMKMEIDGLRQELQHARAAVEHEKKRHAENYEHGQVMEKNLLSMARELEKLRAEMANAEKTARAAAAAVNPNPGYSGNYANPEAGYAGNPYPAGYGMTATNPLNNVQPGAERYPQYGAATASWSAYDMQRAQGHR